MAVLVFEAKVNRANQNAVAMNDGVFILSVNSGGQAERAVKTPTLNIYQQAL
ncbi:MAG: hypothetical protein ACREPB_02925 [Arenimonas sp.]